MFECLMPVTRSRYVTEVGGRTGLLEANQIGLHSGAVLEKTSLSSGENVIVRPLNEKESDSRKSLYAGEVFVVSPIGELHDSRLQAMASEGEAVLSSKCSVGVEEGEDVEINSSYNRLPKDWVRQLVSRRVKS